MHPFLDKMFYLSISEAYFMIEKVKKKIKRNGKINDCYFPMKKM